MSSAVYKNLKSELDQGKKAAVVTLINSGACEKDTAGGKFIFTEEQLPAADTVHHLDDAIINTLQLALHTGTLQYIQASNGASVLIEPYFPETRLIVLGGGHIAKPLAEFGSKAGFSVTVVDDRPMFANQDRFPDAENVICESFNKCFPKLNINESSFVVIVTRGHRQDFVCLKQVLNYKTAYTGMIGSKRRVKAVKEQLLSEGCPEELVNKINAPIGLEIGAVTPEEIAISILAQVISCKRLASTSPVKVNWPELDRLVLEELCNNPEEPMALVTVIATKGSVPRKAGAKMLVWPYGKITGSIGGGCAEGEVINAARQIIGSGRVKIHDVDMAGQISEEEGMVCGGVLKVLIEDCSGSAFF